MRSYHLSTAMLALLALILGAPARAHDITQGDLLIQHPWARPSIGKAPNGAVFMRIVNRGTTADRLISAETERANKTELHTHIHDQGVMRMRPVEGIDLPAGAAIELKPGGEHVMLLGVTKPLSPGLGFPLTLTFARAGKVEVTVAITQQNQDFKAYGGKH
jgi:copper(I)-binding protein